MITYESIDLKILEVEERYINMIKAYCIKDTNNNYGCKLNICSNSPSGRGDYKWDYYSTIFPKTWREGECGRISLELEISKLRELNLLAGYDFDWAIEEFENRDAVVESFVKGRDLCLGRSDGSIVMKDIKKGCVGLHRKMVRETRKKYKAMSKDIGDKYISEKLV